MAGQREGGGGGYEGISGRRGGGGGGEVIERLAGQGGGGVNIDQVGGGATPTTLNKITAFLLPGHK